MAGRVAKTGWLVALALAGPLGAAGSITDQAVTLEYPASHWSSLPAAHLRGTEPAPTADVLYQMGWWYRTDGDTREQALPPPDSEAYSGGKVLSHWANVDGKGFELHESTWVFDNEGPSGGVWLALEIHNLDTVTRSFSVFHYVDLDVAGTLGGDQAASLAANYLKFTDTADASAVMRYRAPFATRFQVGSPATLRGALEDASVTDLSNGGVPFGPGDVAAAFQRTYTLAAGGYVTFEVSLSSRLAADHHKGSYTGRSTFPDLLWHDPLAGTSGGRHMRRTSMLDGWGLNVAPGFVLEATDDFYGSFSDAALYRNPTTGETRVFLSPIAGAPPPPPNWVVAATADFDRDGKADILWRNLTSQRLVIWRMDGSTRVGTITPNPDHAVDANWAVAGVEDFDRDGFQDLLFYNQTSGRLVVWRMDGAVQRITGSFTDPSSVGSNAWRVVAVGDFGRGTGGVADSADIVWQNDVSGRLVVWHMNHALQRTSGLFTTPDMLGASASARVIGPR